MLSDRLKTRHFELGILEDLCQAQMEEIRSMQDGKIYFEDLDHITQEVILDLFVSILENKIWGRERDRDHEKPENGREQV